MAKGKKEHNLDWDALAQMERYELNNLMDERGLGFKGAKFMPSDELRWRIADELGIEIEDENIRAASLNKMDRYELRDLIKTLDLKLKGAGSMDDGELREAIAGKLGLEFEPEENEDDEADDDPAYGDKLDAETAADKLNCLWDKMEGNFLMTKKQLTKFCGRAYQGAFKTALDESLEKQYQMLIWATEKGFAVIFLADTMNLLGIDKGMMKQVFA